jgi:EmrB/QacA subfamily drug resistance transporter
MASAWLRSPVVGEQMVVDDEWTRAGLDPRRARRVLALVSIGFFITALDFTIVNVAFRPIEADFGPGAASLLPWTLSGYSIAFAAGLLTAGRMADAFGRKRAFLLGNVIFTAASMVCGFAPTAAVLVVGRVIQAIGGAMIVPTATALVLPEYPVEQRTHVFGITTAMGSIAAGAGPVVGGVLTTHFGWEWVFLINLPIGVVAITVGARLLRESRDPDAARRPDFLGAALAVVSVGLLVLAIVQGEHWGWGSASTVAVVAAAIALGVAFVGRCRRAADPVLDLTLFRLRYVTVANSVNVLWSMGFYSMYFTNVGWLQEAWGYSAQESGFAYVAGPISATAASLFLARRLRRFGAARVVAAGTGLMAVLNVGFMLLSDETHRFLEVFLPFTVVLGLAIGSVIPVLSSAANGFLPPNRFAMGSAIYTTGRQVGAALGIAVVSALQLASPGIPGLHHSYWFVAGALALGALVMATRFRPPTADQLRAAGATS